MKKAAIIVGVIVLAIVSFLLMSADSIAPSSPVKPSQTFASISAALGQGARLLDVRTPEEYAAGHFAGATNFDSVDIDAGKYPDLAKDTEIYLYCRSGRRATAAAAQLEKAGFTNVINLGGLSDVEALGGTLQKSS